MSGLHLPSPPFCFCSTSLRYSSSSWSVRLLKGLGPVLLTITFGWYSFSMMALDAVTSSPLGTHKWEKELVIRRGGWGSFCQYSFIQKTVCRTRKMETTFGKKKWGSETNELFVFIKWSIYWIWSPSWSLVAQWSMWSALQSLVEQLSAWRHILSQVLPRW